MNGKLHLEAETNYLHEENFMIVHSSKIGLFQKRPIPHPQRKFPPSREGGRGEGNCLNKVLKLYGTSGQGEGVLLISSVGGMHLF